MTGQKFTTIPRHTLVFPTEEGRRRILEEWPGSLGWPQKREIVESVLFASQGRPMPGIARREEMAPREGMLPVGFCSPRSGPEGRSRIAAFVRTDEIEALLSPFDILQKEKFSATTPALKALEEMARAAAEKGVALGVWGSAALELTTGMAFTHAMSDLDILLRPAAPAALKDFLAALSEAEKRHGIRIDAELALANGFGVSLKELFETPASKTVLGKSMQSVELLDKAEIIAALEALGAQEAR